MTHPTKTTGIELTIILVTSGAFFWTCPGNARQQDTKLWIADGFQAVKPTIADVDVDQSSVASKIASGSPIALDDGRFLIVFPDSNAKEILATSSEDGGRTWSKPQSIEKNPQTGVRIVRTAAFRAADGTLWVFYIGYLRYTKLPKTSRSDVWAIRSRDGGRTWEDRRRIWQGYTGMLSNAVQTKGGQILLPFSRLIDKARFASICLVSADNGNSWRASQDVDVGPQTDAGGRARGLTGGALEPSVVELKDGRILMRIRTIVGTLWESISNDGGLTWSKPRPTKQSCGGTQFITRLKSGRLVLVWNQANESRQKQWGFPYGYDAVSIACSDDDGQTWSRPLVFASGTRIVHSLLVETKPGQLLITMPGFPFFLHTTETQLVMPKSDP